MGTGYNMNIVIASGKGGTGKTTLSVSLFKAIKGHVQLLDCDVEAPNCHLFLERPTIDETRVEQQVPVVDADLCTSCGVCDDFCQYNAIVSIAGSEAMVFPELCHSCGGCTRFCPSGAISEKPFDIGSIEHTEIAPNKDFYTGKLNIGLEMASPIIDRLFVHTDDAKTGKNTEYRIIDAPPGTACPFVTTVNQADYVVFITEPTPFGLHDLTLAINTVTELGLPFGVVINRMESTENIVSKYCFENNIDVLLQIENSQYVAECYSRGLSFVDSIPGMEEKLQKVAERILKGSKKA